MIKFAAKLTPAEGKTRVNTLITCYRTRQSAIAGVIPTGPKQINGLGWYALKKRVSPPGPNEEPDISAFNWETAQGDQHGSA